MKMTRWKACGDEHKRQQIRLMVGLSLLQPLFKTPLREMHCSHCTCQLLPDHIMLIFRRQQQVWTSHSSHKHHSLTPPPLLSVSFLQHNSFPVIDSFTSVTQRCHHYNECMCVYIYHHNSSFWTSLFEEQRFLRLFWLIIFLCPWNVSCVRRKKIYIFLSITTIISQYQLFPGWQLFLHLLFVCMM